jgi:hypothetical protein
MRYFITCRKYLLKSALYCNSLQLFPFNVISSYIQLYQECRAKMKITTSIIGALAATALVSIVIPNAYAQVSVPSSVTVNAVCGINTNPAGATLAYGTLTPGVEGDRGQQSADQPLVIRSTGNTPPQVLARGTHWSSTTPAYSDAMLVSATHYTATSGTPYDSKTALTLSNTPIINSLTPGNPVTTYWQLEATLNQADASGTLRQTVTLTAVC